MSFYAHDPKEGEWQKPLEEWDTVQIGSLIHAYIIKEVNEDESDFRNELEYSDKVGESVQHVWK